jgi:hypothetical protein
MSKVWYLERCGTFFVDWQDASVCLKLHHDVQYHTATASLWPITGSHARPAMRRIYAGRGVKLASFVAGVGLFMRLGARPSVKPFRWTSFIHIAP